MSSFEDRRKEENTPKAINTRQRRKIKQQNKKGVRRGQSLF